jgi:uncharacterized protein YecE (DUF72 family)
MSVTKKSNFYGGTSGLVLPVPRTKYPEAFQGKSRLEYYAHLFSSVEINSSFYKLPKEATVRKWSETVGADFQFTFKISKTISHAKGFDYNEEDVIAFMQILNYVENKKGCVLIQFPQSLKSDKISSLKKLLQTINKYNKEHWKIAVEFRNISWYTDDVFELLNKYAVSLVLHDLPSAPALEQLNAGIKYLRFHGPGGRYRGSYTDEFLNEYAQHIKAWLSAGDDVYCYFNNTMGDAVQNLQTLTEMIRGKSK